MSDIATRTQFADSIATKGHAGADLLASKVHAGADAAAAAADKFSIAAKKAADQACAAKDQLATKISENPITSVVIAFGVGALVARMCRR